MERRTRRPRPTVHSATVHSIEDLSPNVRCIRIAGDDLKSIAWSAGQKIKIKVADWLRSYTPARMDTNQGWMDIVFHLHGNGAASQWAASATVGEAIQFVGPTNSIPGADGVPDWALFLGDETTIGLAAALLESLPDSVHKLGAIEVDAEDEGSVSAFGVPLSVTIRTGEHGQSLLTWLNNTTLPAGSGMIWVSGEALSARALREALMERNPPDIQFKLKAYWSSKGHAHRKALEKEQAAKAAAAKA